MTEDGKSKLSIRANCAVNNTNIITIIDVHINVKGNLMYGKLAFILFGFIKH